MELRKNVKAPPFQYLITSINTNPRSWTKRTPCEYPCLLPTGCRIVRDTQSSGRARPLAWLIFPTDALRSFANFPSTQKYTPLRLTRDKLIRVWIRWFLLWVFFLLNNYISFHALFSKTISPFIRGIIVRILRVIGGKRKVASVFYERERRCRSKLKFTDVLHTQTALMRGINAGPEHWIWDRMKLLFPGQRIFRFWGCKHT